MESKQFDDLVGRLASGSSRRAALQGIIGGALAAGGVSSQARAKKRRHCVKAGQYCRIKPKEIGDKHACKRCCKGLTYRELSQTEGRCCRPGGGPCLSQSSCCALLTCVDGFCTLAGVVSPVVPPPPPPALPPPPPTCVETGQPCPADCDLAGSCAGCCQDYCNGDGLCDSNF
jgi:hypothetical protein